MTDAPHAAAGFLGRGPFFWGALFMVGMFGGAALGAFGALEPPFNMLVMLLSMSLLFPMVRALEAHNRHRGSGSEAILRYNRRMLLASFGYVLGLGIAVSVYNAGPVAGAAAFALALLPTLPTFGMIWAMGRYLMEEQDEYLRHRTITASLMSLGLVLSLGIFWGFLETFGVVPHIWAWWVLPVWALGLGIAQSWFTLRDRRSDAEEA